MSKDLSNYRHSVAGIILNKDGKVLVCKPKNKINLFPFRSQWQFPQGGIDGNETTREALIRELREEIGTDKFKILGKSKKQYVYDWPPAIVAERGFLGQKQDYFLMQFTGSDGDVKLDCNEFIKWRWVTPKEAQELHKEGLRKDIYPKVLKEFKLL